MNKIKAQNIWKKFNKLEVLKGIDLEVNEGEVVAVIGPSGGGKSTLLRCLNKLETIDKGSVIIDGEALCTETATGTEYVNKNDVRRIVLPQVIRIILPPISNETITLVKDTSLVYVLAMNDLMRTARNLVQRDFNITPFIVAGCFYLFATLILTVIFERLEKHFSKYDQ